jgi:Cu2+-exporting ATPase
MTTTHSDAGDGACSLCSLPTPESPVTASDVEGSYCCRGCLHVARSLGGTEADDVDPEAALDTGADPEQADGEAAYLAVDGMHCSTCEAFLEARATDREGVEAASASYASGLVRLVFDPDRIDADALPEVLSGTGYRAREAGIETDDDEGLGRLLVGVFFGMMTMLWYVLFLYPAYLGLAPRLQLFSLSGVDGAYLLWNVAAFAGVVLGYTGYPILRGAYVSLRAGRPNMDLLVALASTTAFVYSVGTLLVGGTEVYFDVSVAIVLVVTLGNRYEDRIRKRAAGHLGDLTEQRADSARLRTGDGTETVPIDALDPGDELVVRAGERVPVDGVVVEGTAGLDRSLVTGESRPVRRTAGDEVTGGAAVTEGRLVVRVSEGAESTLDRLVSVLWDVQASRPGTQRLADRIAAVFVPLVVVGGAVTTLVHFGLGASATAALLTGLAVLVVSCPCALGLATPLAVAAGVRESLERGIVITDGEIFERAADADVVALDKTGTLTTGEMRVADVRTDDTEPEAVLARAAAVEQFADHPVARAIVDEAPAGSLDRAVSAVETHPGRGVSATVDGCQVVVGTPDLLRDHGMSVPDELGEGAAAAATDGAIASLVGWDGAARGLVVSGDEPRPGWRGVVSTLAADRRVVVLSGDDEAATRRFATHPDVDETFAGVPPEAKAEVVDRLGADGRVVMVGDGSNDAPALAAADVGISLASGTRLAADAADAVVVDGDLGSVPDAFALTTETRRRVRENLAWAFVYNAVAVPSAALGFLNPLLAAVAMAASSLLVVGNSARSMSGAAERRNATDGRRDRGRHVARDDPGGVSG